MDSALNKRDAFSGVAQIIRFNWPFYAFAIAAIAILFFACLFIPSPLAMFLKIAAFVDSALVLTTLIVSWYVYDYSPLYKLDWLYSIKLLKGDALINIHAGFDETSALLRNKFPAAKLSVLDFYDPVKHTERSIKRARKSRRPFPGTQPVSTSRAVLSPASAQAITLIFAAHEIRDDGERIQFFRSLGEGLKERGSIVVAEHLRDLPNFMAYTLGAFHFLSRKAWLKTFAGAGLWVAREQHVTPFITIFFLQKTL